MKQRPRIYYTERQKALMWERWQKGESLQQIAQLFDRNHSSIERILAETGGIRPAPRCRSRVALTLAEREAISRAVVAGDSIRAIATSLGRAPSTISREIKRNGGHESYRAAQAEQAAWDRARRPKTCKLVQNRALAHIVAARLQWLWSPQQIASWLKHTYPNDECFQVSHETIYRSLFIQARGALKKELLVHLRRTRVIRRSRHHTQKTDQLVAQLRALLESIDRFDTEIDAVAKRLPDYDLFATLPGAGHIQAPRLLVAFGEDRHRYASAAEVQQYAGIAPVIERSGNKCWVHWRLACPTFLRQSFVEWAGSTIPRSYWAGAYYQRQRLKGKSHAMAMRALAFKWIRILYRCWKNRVPYDEAVYLKALQRRGSPLVIPTPS